MILVIGSGADPHVCAVVDALKAEEAEFSIFDAFNAESSAPSIKAADGVRVDLGARPIQLETVQAIWWRQKSKFEVATEVNEMYDYYFIQREWNQILAYIACETRHIFSVNPRDKTRAANDKISQLKLAKAVGFDIPRTLISNSPAAVLDFIQECQPELCIFKPFTPYMPPTGLIAFTTCISSEMVASSPAQLSVSPGIYQEFIRKRCELRVTVVGEELFAAQIDSSHSRETEVDWRSDQFADIYSDYEVDAGLRTRILELHSRLGLIYAAYDFIVTESGKVVFLEVNPSGQWLWLEHRLGHSVSKSIASTLIMADRGQPSIAQRRFNGYRNFDF